MNKAGFIEAVRIAKGLTRTEAISATSQFSCPYAQFNSPCKSYNNRQRKKPPEAGFATGGVIGVIY